VPDEQERDLSLLRRAGVGDRSVLGPLVTRHQDAVFRYARSLVQNDEAAEDVLQETFIDAMRGAATFRGDSRVRTWLFTPARHAAFRHARLRTGEPRRHESLDVLGTRAGWGGDDPEVRLEQTQRRALLARAMGRLDRDEHEILLLRELEDLSGAETAELLALTVPAMKSRLHRARLRLAANVRREVSDGP
jgi:RNA polymerase sigma-70 factor, ECF subfamily